MSDILSEELALRVWFGIVHHVEHNLLFVEGCLLFGLAVQKFIEGVVFSLFLALALMPKIFIATTTDKISEISFLIVNLLYPLIV